MYSSSLNSNFRHSRGSSRSIRCGGNQVPRCKRSHKLRHISVRRGKDHGKRHSTCWRPRQAKQRQGTEKPQQFGACPSSKHRFGLENGGVRIPTPATATTATATTKCPCGYWELPDPQLVRDGAARSDWDRLGQRQSIFIGH